MRLKLHVGCSGCIPTAAPADTARFQRMGEQFADILEGLFIGASLQPGEQDIPDTAEPAAEGREGIRGRAEATLLLRFDRESPVQCGRGSGCRKRDLQEKVAQNGRNAYARWKRAWGL